MKTIESPERLLDQISFYLLLIFFRLKYYFASNNSGRKLRAKLVFIYIRKNLLAFFHTRMAKFRMFVDN